jgi:beta-barrel assembly-enhancing protease
MAGFFYNLGRMVGPNLRKANWVMRSLTGTPAEAVRAEQQVGRDLAQAFVRQMEVDHDPAVVQALEEVSGRLVPCVRDRDRAFTFRAVRSQEVNAFAFPGGFIFIMRPLLEFCCWDRDEIAFVLGHEMGHVLKRHAVNRLMASSLVSTGISHIPVGGVLAAPVLNLAATLLNQGYSQDNELEADNIGMQLLHAASFDPSAALRVLKRLQTVPAEAVHLSSYFSSHPPVEIRLHHVERFIKSH